MLTRKLYSPLCTSLRHAISEECRPRLADIQSVVTRSLGFETKKLLFAQLKQKNIELNSDFYKKVCANLKVDFEIDFAPSIFAFPWPNSMTFQLTEIDDFWQSHLDTTPGIFGWDSYKVLSPLVKHKNGNWFVSPKSVIPVDTFNELVGDVNATCEPSHTDIDIKVEAGDDVKSVYKTVQTAIQKEEYQVAYQKLKFVLAQDKQHSGATRDLAMLYLQGNYVEQDLKKAEQLYTIAAKLGCPVASHVLGVSYDFDGEFTTDLSRAFMYHQQAIDRGNHHSIICLIAMLEFNRGIPDNFNSEYIRILLSKALKLRSLDVLQRIVSYYEQHEGIDASERFELLKIVQNEYSNVQLPNDRFKTVNYNLALYYLTGTGCKKNVDLALKHFKVESELFSDADSMFQISMIYKNEIRDFDKSEEWLLKALDNIDGTTISAVKICCDVGELEYKRRNHDIACSMFFQSIIYENDFNYLKPQHVEMIEQQKCIAMYWIEKAAEAGIEPATILLEEINNAPDIYQFCE